MPCLLYLAIEGVKGARRRCAGCATPVVDVAAASRNCWNFGSSSSWVGVVGVAIIAGLGSCSSKRSAVGPSEKRCGLIFRLLTLRVCGKFARWVCCMLPARFLSFPGRHFPPLLVCFVARGAEGMKQRHRTLPSVRDATCTIFRGSLTLCMHDVFRANYRAPSGVVFIIFDCRASTDLRGNRA